MLDSMVETHAITREQADKAKAAPLKLAPPNVEASDAPYFVDMVRDSLISKFNENELNDQSYRIYTTLDPDLQKAAAQAVESGIKLVDEQVKKLRTKRVKVGKKYETKVAPGPQAQVAHGGARSAHRSGAGAGGRTRLRLEPAESRGGEAAHGIDLQTVRLCRRHEYGARWIGDGDYSGLNGRRRATTFAYGDQIYEPRNYKEEYHGDVTLRYALAMSLNNATVKVAEEVGYDKVADLAKSAGIASVKATPAMALGILRCLAAGHGGSLHGVCQRRSAPVADSAALGAERQGRRDRELYDGPAPGARSAHRLRHDQHDGRRHQQRAGTIPQCAVRGFTPPAAGKTGSSHDGWFAGYTSNLLCIVWVGYDDYSDLRLTGAMTAGADLDGVHEEGRRRCRSIPTCGTSRSLPAWSTCSSIKRPTGWRLQPARTIMFLLSWPGPSPAKPAMCRQG